MYARNLQTTAWAWHALTQAANLPAVTGARRELTETLAKRYKAQVFSVTSVDRSVPGFGQPIAEPDLAG